MTKDTYFITTYTKVYNQNFVISKKQNTYEVNLEGPFTGTKIDGRGKRTTVIIKNIHFITYAISIITEKNPVIIEAGYDGNYVKIFFDRTMDTTDQSLLINEKKVKATWQNSKTLTYYIKDEKFTSVVPETHKDAYGYALDRPYFYSWLN